MSHHDIHTFASGGDTGEKMPKVEIVCLGVLYKLAFFLPQKCNTAV